jgi:hypothetical protein
VAVCAEAPTGTAELEVMVGIHDPTMSTMQTICGNKRAA